MAYYPFLPYDKSEYLDMMQDIPETRGYLTSPIFQEGFEEWNPSSPPEDILQLQTYLNMAAEATRQLMGARGANVMGGIGTKESPPSGYPYPDYDPARWGMEFGHEIGHSGMKQTNPFYDFTSKLRSPLDYKEGGAEETLSRLHDYMYGNYKEPFWGSGASSFLRQRGYIEPNEPGQMHYNVDFTPKAYDAIRNSNLKDWQKGVMSLGPTTSRGQIGLGQRPDQVKAQGEAYMSPDRGRHTRPTMTQREMRNEAERTGGSVNPFEATRAQYKKGGIASLCHR
jgi:hypothetical protein|tara:strand:+ start:292 stop:1137 length:846 start_codon:yes stop_codon:yes gene_type:complete